MNELVTRSIQDGNLTYMAQFPHELLAGPEQELFEWVLDFNQHHGAPPSVKATEEQFSFYYPWEFTPTPHEPKPQPLSATYEQLVQQKLAEISTYKLRQAEEQLRISGEVPLDTLEEIAQLHTLAQGVVRYSLFDRSLYFRRSTLHLPFSLLEKHTGGLANGDFMLLVGRLGTGKSTVAQYMAKEFWEQHKRILFVSAEMLSLDVFSRIDAMVGSFNPLTLREGQTPDITRTLTKVVDRARKHKGEIIIPRNRLLSPAQISGFAKHLDVDLIIVDGAYLLQPSGGKYTSKWEKVATVSNQLKQMALDLQLPLIATAQIKRGASAEAGYDPEDIALSDALGQDSDFIVAIAPNNTLKGRMELQLIKNRYGSRCATQIFIDFETMKVTDESIAGAVADASPSVETVTDWFERKGGKDE